GHGSNYTNSVALADVNGDGKLDLVLGNGVGVSALDPGITLGNASWLFINQGVVKSNDEDKGPFGIGQVVGDPFANTQAGAFADLNGDGRPDLITANASRPSEVFLNNGSAIPFSGFRGSGIAFGGDGILPATSLAVGDLNADGRPDIVLGVDGK